MKNLLIAVALFLGSWSLVSAQEAVGPALFIGSYTLWIAIVLGIVSSLWIFYYSFQMKGSTVGEVLRLIGFGMLMIVLGFLAVVVQWADPSIVKVVHDIAFILGYILVLTGASKLKRLRG